MAAADRCQPTIIGMSALLTTTMTYMKTVIDGFEAAGRGHIKMAVGGAPISQMFADEIGADGYGQNASAAVDSFAAGQQGPPRIDCDLRDSERSPLDRGTRPVFFCSALSAFFVSGGLSRKGA
jgi:hypothetical protein